jgi:hypothetical protein
MSDYDGEYQANTGTSTTRKSSAGTIVLVALFGMIALGIFVAIQPMITSYNESKQLADQAKIAEQNGLTNRAQIIVAGENHQADLRAESDARAAQLRAEADSRNAGWLAILAAALLCIIATCILAAGILWFDNKLRERANRVHLQQREYMLLEHEKRVYELTLASQGRLLELTSNPTENSRIQTAQYTPVERKRK